MTNNVYTCTEMIKEKRLTCYVDKYINIFGMLHFLVALDCFSPKLVYVCSQNIKDCLEDWVSSWVVSSSLRLISTLIASSIVISSYGVNCWLLQSVNNHKNQAEWILLCVNGTWVLNLLRIFQSKLFIWVTARRGAERPAEGITPPGQLS